MAFDEAGRFSGVHGRRRGRRVAVIGSGAAGLAAAWRLTSDFDVTLIEAADRIGGHAQTVETPFGDGGAPVDVGFIVFNKPSYPNFTAWLEALGVKADLSCMSFAASLNDGAIEYSGQTLRSVFASPVSALSLGHWRMLRDVILFHRRARRAIDADLPLDISLGAFVATHQFSAPFVDRFLKPMGAAIWSSPANDVLRYPAINFFRFFANHGLLQVLNLPEWHTVKGGSKRYVEKVAQTLTGPVLTGVAVKRLEKAGGKVRVIAASGPVGEFDDVVIAAHADAALSMLAEPSPAQAALLGAFAYQRNIGYLHTDETQMPKRRLAWSSWNYLGDRNQASVTYWMNRLQNLNCSENVFVTLNPSKPIDDAKVFGRYEYDHPIFDVAAGRAQREIWRLQGEGGVWFCGAHFGQGFHEDAVQSGLAVAEAMGATPRPWRVENENGRIWAHPRVGCAAQ